MMFDISGVSAPAEQFLNGPPGSQGTHEERRRRDGSPIKLPDESVWTLALEAMPQGIALLDAVTDTTLWINTALQRLLQEGIGEHHVLGQSPTKYLPCVDAETWETARQFVLSGGTSVFPRQRGQFVNQPSRDIAFWEWSVTALESSEHRLLLLTVDRVTDQVMNERGLISLGGAEARARQRAEALGRVSALMNASLSTAELTAAVAEEAANYFGLRHAAVLLLQQDGETLEVRNALGLLAPQVGQRLHIGSTPAGLALADGKMLHLVAPFAGGLETPLLDSGERPVALVSCPILHGEHRYGVLEIYYPDVRNVPVDSLELLTAFSEQTAAALHRADLYEEIIAQRRQLQSIFDNASVGIAYFDFHGRPLAINTAAARICSLSAQDAANSALTAFLGDVPVSALDAVRLGECFQASHNVYRRPGESDVVCEVSLVPVPDEKGQVKGILLLLVDVTELVLSRESEAEARQQAEKALDEVNAMQAHLLQTEKLRAIGVMASGMAHNLNNILQPIYLLAEDSLDCLQTPQTDIESLHEILIKNLTRIQQSADDAAVIVRRVQTYSRSRREMSFEATDVRKLVMDVVDLLRPQWKDEAEKEGRLYNLQLALHPVPLLLVEQSSIREVLNNLIRNALLAMPDGGDLTLTTRLSEPDEVEIEVRDTGVGMSADVLTHIFDPFFSTRGVKGSGLGLYVSQGIMRQHGGDIKVQSAPGAGTSFLLHLPIRAGIPASTARKNPVRQAAPAKVAHILVVDDEPVVLSILSGILAKHGHEVTAAGSAETALEYLRQNPHHFDIVLSDHGMPGMNGLQFVAATRRLWPDLPVVLLTGWGESILQTQKENARPNAVLSKPINQTDLLQVVALNMRSREADA